MKLRNKNTGEIREDSDLNKMLIRYAMPSYDSIAELCEDWEDYKPAEPLIRDEKIRKAVRAWWESIPMEIDDKQILYKKNQDFAIGVYTIYCGAIYPEGTLKEGNTYTITELCGEEEE